MAAPSEKARAGRRRPAAAPTAPAGAPDPSTQKERLEIYKMLVDMADRVSQRRQAANSFYLSVNTLLVGGSAYLGTLAPGTRDVALISIAGMAICALWIRSIGSYRSLNAAKFGVIQDMERGLPVQPFADEWARLAPPGDARKHRPFYAIEIGVPWVFIAIYALQVAATLPWRGWLAASSL